MFEVIPTFKATIYSWEIKRLGIHHVIIGWTGKERRLDNTIRTSNIEFLNLKDGWVKTRNSFYALEVEI